MRRHSEGAAQERPASRVAIEARNRGGSHTIQVTGGGEAAPIAVAGERVQTAARSLNHGPQATEAADEESLVAHDAPITEDEPPQLLTAQSGKQIVARPVRPPRLRHPGSALPATAHRRSGRQTDVAIAAALDEEHPRRQVPPIPAPCIGTAWVL